MVNTPVFVKTPLDATFTLGIVNVPAIVAAADVNLYSFGPAVVALARKVPLLVRFPLRTKAKSTPEQSHMPPGSTVMLLNDFVPFGSVKTISPSSVVAPVIARKVLPIFSTDPLATFSVELMFSVPVVEPDSVTVPFVETAPLKVTTRVAPHRRPEPLFRVIGPVKICAPVLLL